MNIEMSPQLQNLKPAPALVSSETFTAEVVPHPSADNGSQLKDFNTLFPKRSLSTYRQRAAELEAMGWVIEGLARPQDIIMLHAPAGAGKSFFLQHLTTAAAGAGTMEAFEFTERKSVLYLDGEMNERQYIGRLDFALEAFGLTERDIADHMDHRLLRTSLGGESEVMDLNLAHHQKALLAYVEQTRPDIIVIDNIRTMFRLNNEKDVEGWHTVNKFALQLSTAQKNGCVIVVHHSNKYDANDQGDGKGKATYAGSSNAITNMTGVIGLTPFKYPHGPAFRLEADKARDGETAQNATRILHFNTETRQWVCLSESEVTAEKLEQQQKEQTEKQRYRAESLVAALETMGFTGKTQLGRDSGIAGVTKNNVTDILAAGVKLGIFPAGNGATVQWSPAWYFSLAKNGTTPEELRATYGTNPMDFAVHSSTDADEDPEF